MKAHYMSQTALVVAKSLVLTGSRPETFDLVDPASLEFAKRALRFAGQEDFCHWVRSASYRWMVTRMESMTIPGLTLHHALRKRAIEARVRRAITEGATQVAVIGAGFDSLSYRLAQVYPRVRFVELDHPATQRVKRQFLGSHGMKSLGNLRLAPLDLSHHVEFTELDSNRKTIAVIEGVLMYLPFVRAAAVLSGLRHRLEEDSLILFTVMALQGGAPAFRDQTGWADLWLRARGEPFHWGCQPGQLASLLNRLGLTPGLAFSTRDYARRNFPGLEDRYRIAEGEWIAEAANRPAMSSARCSA